MGTLTGVTSTREVWHDMSDQLGVIIGLKEIYDELKAVGSKVDRVLNDQEQIRADVIEIRADAADKEARIRALEKARWPLPSLAALIGVASIVLTVVFKYT